MSFFQLSYYSSHSVYKPVFDFNEILIETKGLWLKNVMNKIRYN